MSAMQFFPGISLADTTTYSFQATPGPNLICWILPRAIVLRTVAPYNIPGKTMSSTYCARPVALSRPSFRGTDTPTIGPVVIGMTSDCRNPWVAALGGGRLRPNPD